MRLGPGRGRHEGHGRHDPGRGPAADAGAAGSAARRGARIHRGRRGGRQIWGRLLLPGRAAPGTSFEGVTEAIGEVGGYSVSDRQDGASISCRRPSGGIAWLRLTATGTAGHGAMVHPDNAVTELAEAVARIGRHDWPLAADPGRCGRSWREASAALGTEYDPDDPEAMLGQDRAHSADHPGPCCVTRSTRPGCRRGIQGERDPAGGGGRGRRPLPARPGGRVLRPRSTGCSGPGVRREFIHHDIAVETRGRGRPLSGHDRRAAGGRPGSPGGALHDVRRHGREGRSASSASAASGYAPLQLPADLDFSGMFHGIDEHVPVDGLRYGVRVLERISRPLLSTRRRSTHV